MLVWQQMFTCNVDGNHIIRRSRIEFGRAILIRDGGRRCLRMLRPPVSNAGGFSCGYIAVVVVVIRLLLLVVVGNALDLELASWVL